MGKLAASPRGICAAAPVLVATVAPVHGQPPCRAAGGQRGHRSRGHPGPGVQASPRFPRGVNVGFLQVQDRGQVRLRVFERGVGETLACGTGACAAVVAGIRLGLLDADVQVQTRGGAARHRLGRRAGPAWLDAPVLMTGPATTVFQAEIEIPDNLSTVDTLHEQTTP